jgi:sulfur carrier protein ThiS
MGAARNRRLTITVELKIIGFIGGAYVHVIIPIEAQEGDSLRELLRAAFSSGRIDKGLHGVLRRRGKGVAVMVNGEMASEGLFRKMRLRNGDSVLFYNAVAGG